MTGYSHPDLGQPVIRALVEALSHPGRSYPLPDTELLSATGLDDVHRPLAAVAWTLMDHEVSFSVVGDESPALTEQLFAMTKAQPATVDRADFIFVIGASSQGAVADAKRGSLAYPDLGATLIYQLPSTSPAGAAAVDAVRWEGPGIDGHVRPDVPGLSAQELMSIDRVNQHYPLGVDAFFIDHQSRVVGLPRSTRFRKN